MHTNFACMDQHKRIWIWEPTVNTTDSSSEWSLEVCATSPLTLDSYIESLTLWGDKKRRKFFTDYALDKNVSMLVKLDTTYDHLPISPKIQKSRFGLREGVGVDTPKQVMICPTCDMHIFLTSFKKIVGIQIYFTKQAIL